MNKILNFRVLLLVVVAVMTTWSCKRDADPADNDNPATQWFQQYAGQYDLAITYTTYMDGEPADETNSWTGKLTITATDDPRVVEVEGVVSLSGNNVILYQTTGHIDDQGVLKLNPSVFHNDANGLNADITYNDINPQWPLHFESEFNTILSGVPIRYVMVNDAQKIDQQ